MNLEVETTGGRIRGRSRRGIALFAGIPYAAPPVGELRWAPPQPAPRWRGVRDATRFGLAAPQVAATGMAGRLEVPWREDCLTLNVATPAADGGSRPVLVWIHGGAFRHGTSATPWYDGTSFAARGDVVVVSLNYRLGALGFCRLPGEPTSGLNGILDQIAALEWVRDNISAFGGDPAQVTVAGESAGAFSVVTLLSMERSAGLFQRAIAQSGAGHHVLGASRAALVAESLLHELDAADIDEARQRSTVEVLAAQSRVEARAHELLSRVEQPFYPSIDGDLLPARPVDLLAKGAGAEVALLTGTNADEMTLFGLGATTEESLAPAMAHYVDPPDELIALYRAAHPEASAGQIAVALTTDHVFRIPAIRAAEARWAHAGDTWMYLFDWKSRAFGGFLGATHALEIPFTFATLDVPGVELFLGTKQPPVRLSDAMHGAWTAFVRSGTPQTDVLPAWQPYDPGGRAVLRFADDIEVLADPPGAIREAWTGLR